MDERKFLINMIVLMYKELEELIELEFQCTVAEYVNDHIVNNDDLKMTLMVAQALVEDMKGD